MSEDEGNRRGRGRRKRDEIDQFANSSGVSTTITSILAFHKNKGHIKESDLKKIVPEFNRTLRNDIAARMRGVFGLNLKEDEAGKILYLYSEVCSPPRYKMLGIFQGNMTLADFLQNETHAVHDEEEEANDSLQLVEDSFLVLVLTVVLMNSTPPSDAHPKGSGLRLITLENILRDAGLEPPVQLGPLKKFIDNSASAVFISRGWLTYRDEDLEGSKHTSIFWGPLAHATLRPMHILELYCKMVDAQPHEFVDIYSYAEKLESQLGPKPSMLFVSENKGEVTATQTTTQTQSVDRESDEDMLGSSRRSDSVEEMEED